MEDAVDDEHEEDWSLPVEDDRQSCGVEQTTSKQNPSPYVHSDVPHLGHDKTYVSKYGHQRTIIQIDIDCFYAQVEMIRNPELRNKPLGIKQKYLLVTCNYVARQYGVTKLMGIKEAKEKCPGLVIVSGEDLTHYREMSYKISEFLQKYTANVERLGFDENFLDVSEMVDQRLQNVERDMEVKGHVYGNLSEKDRGNETEIPSTSQCSCGCRLRLTIGSQIASEIRQALNEELGITCCAGISYNKLLAKLVGGQHKPNQQTTLFPEQTSEFMSKLSRARDIPGVGWTTSKKLSSLGVCSVVNLQEVPLSDLVEEIGETSAVHIKELSFGIDDSPVVLFKRPQTLSDEDSFKKCSTEVEVRSKVRELLSSLIIRLKEDGRIPHTVRLTIRRFTTTNKYTSRESRQCPIPSNVLSKGDDNMEQSVSKLLDLVMTLFHKLVNVYQSFHLTLINIAFCNLQDKAKNSISSFFSPKKIKDIKSLAETENTQHRQQEDSKDTESVNKPVMSPTSNLQKWLNSSKSERSKSTGTLNQESNVHKIGSRSEKTLESSFDTIEYLSEINKTGLKTNKEKSFFGIGVKRKKDIGMLDEEVKKKKLSTSESLAQTEVSSCSETSDSSGVLPADIDPEVFSNLPLEVQQELIQDFKSKSDKKAAITNNNAANVGGTCEHFSKDTSSEMLYKGGNSALLNRQCSSSSFQNTCNEGLINQSDRVIETLDTAGNSEVTSSRSDNRNSLTCSVTSSSTVPELDNNDSGMKSLPPDVDREVFVNLPADIQKEILEQYKHSITKNKSKPQSCVTSKQNLTSKKPSILNYFGTARKS